MIDISELIQLILLYGASFVAGVACFWAYQRLKLGSFDRIAKEIIQKADSEADTLRRNSEFASKQSQIDQKREFDERLQIERRRLQKEEERILQKEDKLEQRLNTLERKLAEIDKREVTLGKEKGELAQKQDEFVSQQKSLRNQLEQIAGISSLEAKDILFSALNAELASESALLVRRRIKEAEESADKEAQRIISTAITRLAVPCVSEATVATVALPNEEMKGRIIGREGRNIRTFERATGITFIIDDTPNAVVLSGFDPVKMQIAKVALSELVKDGRIHPTRIEEVVVKAQENVEKQIKLAGEDAALRVGALGLAPELIRLLGKLKFRFSYGQNILDHSIEVSYLMGLMAGELGLDVRVAKRIGLLHDMGKAVSHEIDGSHAIVGHNLALKFGETKTIANGIGCHHFEMDAESIEGSLCSAADSISASRQGARSEPVEEYVKRLQKLEELAHQFQGVERAYAMQAGREIRVMVTPELVDDAATIQLARQLTRRIEEELHYPGKIKVLVIREKRALEYAF